MKKIYKYLLITLLPFLGSCAAVDEPTAMEVSKSDPIAEMVSNYYYSVNPPTRAYSAPKIISTETKHYIIDSDSVIETTTTRADDDAFEITTATLQFKESKGYAILSRDKRLDKIFFFTEKGCLSDTADIPMLKDYIINIPGMAASEIKSEKTDTRASADDVMIYPLVRFHWHQREPFNRYATTCTCNECAQRGNHRLAGCVTVATAQAIATMGKFNGTFYGNRNIDFTQLPAYGFFMNDAQAQTVAQFFHEVAICCQVEFGCNGSGSTIKAAYQYLKDLGYNCTYEEKEINVAKLKDELSKGIPHLIAGRSFEAGHMWIVDGLKITGGKTYFNCNWGWGGASDGWADSYPFIPNGETDIKNIFSQNIRNIYIYSKL